MADFNVQMLINLAVRGVPQIQQLQRHLKVLTGQLNDANSRAELIAANDRAIQHWRQQALEVGAMAFALGAAIRPAVQFEGAMADVAKVIEFDRPDGLALMSEDILALSRDIPVVATGLADIVAAAGQANVVDSFLPDAERRAQLIEFTQDAARMGVAFEIAAGVAGDRMAGLRNIFGQTQDQVRLTTDAVNFLANSMAALAPDILRVLERSGSTARLFGLTAEQNAALAASFLALKTPPEVAGTAINAMLQKLATAPQQGKVFNKTLKALGVNATDLKRAIEEDAQGALVSFLETVRGAEDVQGALLNLFGLEFADDVAKLVNSLDVYQGAIAAVSDQANFAGSALAEFEIRASTVGNEIALFRNRLTELSIVLGTQVLPVISDMIGAITPVVSEIAEWIKANPELTRGLFLVVAAALALKLAAVALFWPLASIVGMFLRAWPVLALVGRIALPGVALALGLVSRAVIALGAVMLANPVGAILTAIASAAYLIVTNWEPIAAFFQRVWERVKAIFTAAWEQIKPIVDAISGAFDILDRSDLPGVRSGRNASRRERGGPVLAGQTYLVGEAGPELFRPTGSGVIVPNHRLGGGQVSAPARQIGDVAIHIHGATDPEAAAQAVRRELRRIQNSGGDLHDGHLVGRRR